MIFVFATVALFCSAVCEVFATFTQKRAKLLVAGLRSMLDQTASGAGNLTLDTGAAQAEAQRIKDIVTGQAGAAPGTPGAQVSLTLALFGHPLVEATTAPKLRTRGPGTRTRAPSYLSATLFARALIDTLVPDADGQTDITTIMARVQSLPDGLPAKASLLSLLRKANTDVATFTLDVENWYDGQMARVSGWYKRWSQLVLGIVGLVVAAVINIDTFHIAHQVYVDEPLRTVIVAQAESGALCNGDVAAPSGTLNSAAASPNSAQDRVACSQQEVGQLGAAGLPIWWTGDGPSGIGWLAKIVGLIVTAFAVSFGAPFWFGALSRITPMRSTGPKPPTGGSGSS